MMRSFGMVVIGVSLVASVAHADAPAYLPVQGVLATSDGTPVDGDTDMTFTLYVSDIATDSLWTETQTVLVEDGFFTAYLGDVAALDLALFRDNGTVWMGVRVGTDAEMPRFQVGTTGFAAFAQYAGDADTLDGSDATAFAATGHEHAWGDLTSGIPSDLADGDDGFTTEGELTTLLDDNYLYTGAAPITVTGNVIGLDPASCPADGVWQWNGTAWACVAAAGGDVTGLAAGDGIALTNPDGPMVTVGIADAGVTSAKIADGSVLFGDWNQNGCSANEVPKWTGSAWDCRADVVGLATEAELTTLLDDNYAALGHGHDWSALSGVPSGLADGDDDTLAGLGCDPGEIPAWGGTSWGCAADADTTYTGDDFALSDQSCDPGDIVTGVTAIGGLACRNGGILNLASCTAGQVPRSNGSGGWTCGDASNVVFIETPGNVRLTCAAANVTAADQVPPNVPATAKAILANITTYNNAAARDHVMHSFGRNAAHNPSTWDNQAYTLNTWLNDVLITHNGDSAGSDYYGYSHGTSVIPLKANGRFDARLCMGYSAGTHYITIQVIGYIE